MYQADEKRYETMKYHRCGASGLMLPELSLGLWHNFGDTGVYENMKQMCFTAFDNGITHFDLANNYGPQPGSAEENFGKILREEFSAYRDELIVSTKAGYDMWPGPYGNWGSRKYLIASLDQSLKRLGLDYVDIFYHHRMDPETPLEETMEALAQIVRSGKALYVGISNYDGETMKRAADILEELHCPFIINQNRYNIFNRTIETNGLKQAAAEAKQASDNKLSWQQQKEEQARQRKRENELKKVEARIEELETRDKEIDETMILPDICTNVAECAKLSKEKAAITEELETLYEKWEELA